MADESVHSKHVSEWLKRFSRVRREELAELFEKALTALWQRTYSALGDITVAAIVDRVLYNAADRYPFLSSLKVDATGVSFAEFRNHASSITDRELKEAIQFVLVELLTVVGNLTAEVLTPALHSELTSVTVKNSRGKHSGEKKL